ncbi:F-box family protein [Perilla frutescens var. hirtella]|uniref:F-box family protein n=1 Tax=Perilla frutescens var. hirtella TaxID=608512 RepID=A0AAD4J561_PERFH|nr:F-box family protein [Perilla frutescens var. frutescens]KAH6827390.1 F-box family protein [Perilla frutescens var. hirtella]
MSETGVFSKLSDDIILNILSKLDDDPRNWARIACASTKFSSLITTVCFRAKCSQSIPSVVCDLLSSAAAAAAPPGGWEPLYKLAVCCPGLSHSGVLADNSDLGLEESQLLRAAADDESSAVSWRDDLWIDRSCHGDSELGRAEKPDFTVCKRRRICRPFRSHLASGVWNLSREQGNKLLASRFKGDCLYISDWPGCVHVEEKRNYMLFRGIFKNFKESRVWRTVNDGNKSRIDFDCAFCSSKQMWDLHSSFCLRRYFGYHDDGEPVVRAYVCENGHVSGAWTDWPLYT